MATAPSRLPRPWDGHRKVLRVMLLLRAEGGEEKPAQAPGGAPLDLRHFRTVSCKHFYDTQTSSRTR